MASTFGQLGPCGARTRLHATGLQRSAGKVVGPLQPREIVHGRAQHVCVWTLCNILFATLHGANPYNAFSGRNLFQRSPNGGSPHLGAACVCVRVCAQVHTQLRVCSFVGNRVALVCTRVSSETSARRAPAPCICANSSWRAHSSEVYQCVASFGSVSDCDRSGADVC